MRCIENVFGSAETGYCPTRSFLPSGWNHNPSAWTQRSIVVVLAIAGLVIAVYLGLYQLGLIDVVWEPFFGEGSHRVLKESIIAHILPIPDAMLGATVYLLDAAAGVVGGVARWRTMPWIVVVQSLLAGVLAAGGITLAVLQGVVVDAYCTLCLASAACSVLMAALVLLEVLATVQFLRSETQHGHSLWRALRGREDWATEDSASCRDISPNNRHSKESCT